MGYPTWITPAGSLGTIPEGVFYQIPLRANITDPLPGEEIYYKMIAGKLPPGVQCTKTGLIEGTPQAVSSLQGVPLPVGQDVTSKFTVRIYTEINEIINHISDRTFTLTVTGEDFPDFITPAGSLGTFYDGVEVSIQLEFSDSDPNDVVYCFLASGELPPGLTLSTSGLISGYIIPAPLVNQIAGYDKSAVYSFPYDFLTKSISKNYQFTLELTDGKASNIRTYTIYVYSRDSMTADTTDFTADNLFITADETSIRLPILLNNAGSIGTIRHDNYFAYKFNAVDLDGNQIQYLPDIDTDGSSITDSSLELPPGTTLDPNTGWLYGYIPDLGINETTFNFGVTARKISNPEYESPLKMFSLTVIGNVNATVVWITPSFIGSIDNGGTSIFYVEAYNVSGKSLSYSLLEGAFNSLPQGLKLLPNGLIVGRVSFNTFALDGGTTTFDKIRDTRLDINAETTFDLDFTFTVQATSSEASISSTKQFTIKVNRIYNEPYQNLYIQGMLPLDDRELLNNILEDSRLFDPKFIYRFNDTNFGLQKEVIYWHTYGLTASTIEDYYKALEKNHYWKTLILGKIKTAQATDVDGNVIYEVIYSEIIDDLVNQQGQSVSKSVTLPYPVNEGDSTEITTVYPNSLINMRNQVIDTVGQISRKLPLWMTSKQRNGNQLGFVPSWVIAYVKPGQADKIAYRFNQYYGVQFNKIDFSVDRYELDRTLSIHWDPNTDSWIPAPDYTFFDNNSTTFDKNSLLFIRPVDMYVSSDIYNKYLVFSKRNILE